MRSGIDTSRSLQADRGRVKLHQQHGVFQKKGVLTLWEAATCPDVSEDRTAYDSIYK